MSKAYFLAPTRDTPPKGPIFLGSIITAPRSPELSVNGKKSPFLTTLDITTSSLTDSTRILFKTGDGKAGVWAEFIQGVGVGGKASVNWNDAEMAKYKFEELITKTISPEFPEIVTAFAEPSVQQAIKDSRFRDNVYMITGIKSAKGAEVAISKIKARGKNFQFGIDTTPAGFPLKFGPEFEMNKGEGEGLTEKHSKEQEFVFAYRLREITYKRKKVGEQKEYLKGDLQGHGQNKGEEVKRDESLDVPELEEWKGEEETLKAMGIETKEAVDDDEKAVLIIPLEEEEDDE